MSLGVVIKGPEGIVLATDSRITLEAQRKGSPIPPVNFDNTTKLLSFSEPHNYVGVVTYGAAVIGLRTAHSLIPEFEQEILSKEEARLTIKEYGDKLSIFFNKRWKDTMPSDYKGPNMTFIVGGYDPDAAYGKIFLFEIPGQPDPKPRHEGNNDFGMTWGGQLEVVSRLIHGFDPTAVEIIKKTLNLDDKQRDQIYQAIRQELEYPIPYMVLPLQDCVNLAVFLVRATMTAQHLAVGIRGVGGPIDVAVITRTKPLDYVQQKQIHGETV